MAEKETELPLNSTISPSFAGLPFERLRRQINRVLEEFASGRNIADFEPFGRFVGEFPTDDGGVDFVEKEKEYEITAELPGLDSEDIEVKLSNGILTIGGEKKKEKEEKRDSYYFLERRYGSFKRAFQVPLGVDTEKVEASLEKGVLTVRLPKTPDAQKARKIEIKTKY